MLEDDAVVRAEIIATIDRDPELDVVGHTGSLAAARQRWRAWAPALAVVDLQLSDGDATTLIPELRAGGVASLVLTVSEGEARVFAALTAGAGGYLVKADALANVAEALRSLRDGGAPMSPQIARRLLDNFRHRAGVAPAGGDAELTPRERQVIGLFSQGATYREVGTALGVSPNTVRQHVRNIYDKLHVSSKTEAVLRTLGRS